MVRPRGRLRGEVNMVTMATMLIVTLDMVIIVKVNLEMVNFCRLQVKGGVNLLH